MTEVDYIFESGKTFTHSQGFSCVFRQWRAQSHCNQLHGYALQIEFEFEASNLDGRNWVADFGGFKKVKEWLTTMFDHTMLVANDDPEKQQLLELGRKRLAEVRLVDAVGCEKFAEMIFRHVIEEGYFVDENPTIMLKSVRVREHESNWAGVRRVT